MARTKIDFASREDADERDHAREAKPDKKGRKKTKRGSWRKK